ncbi:MAG: carbohydrate-binding domain-containing protein, partial [Oscillospiraceae bacterium]|nr:carbohydrate-binding domain-containing protein [Oscillospiraceae bacterium]
EADRTLVAHFEEAGTSYPLWLRGIQVTSRNAADILGDGTAKYEGDASSRTLTLTNADIRGGVHSAWLNDTFALYTEGVDLTLVLSGPNVVVGGTYGIAAHDASMTIQGDGSLEIQASKCGIRVDAELTVTGSCSLVVSAANGLVSDADITIVNCSIQTVDSSAFGISSLGAITIAGSTVDVTTDGYAISAESTLTIAGSTVEATTSAYYGIDSNDSIVISDSRVSCSAKRCAFYGKQGITLGEGLVILEPAGASIENGMIYANGDLANYVVIGPPLTSVAYVDAQGNDMEPVTEFTVVSADNTAWSTGWYVVTADTQIDGRIGVSGDVDLILCDGAVLTAVDGINVGEGNALTIWQQSGGTGGLTISGGGDRGAGLGGNYRQSGGTITINGGDLSVTNGQYAAAIGGGETGSGGTITINGGTIKAICGRSGGSGIGGGGSYGAGGTITINGGAVTAQGGESGSGIGGGDLGSGGTITIHGGTVTANGGRHAAGIGGGYYNRADCTITINGGTVTAQGGAAGAGIGGGKWGMGGNVTISGGTVTATAGSLTQAIGKGYGGPDEGSLDLPGMRVTDPAGTLAADRIGACRVVEGSVTLEPCHTHEYAHGCCKWCGDIVLDAVPIVYGKSLSLKGKIALNVYLILPESVTADPGAYVTFGGEKLLVSSARTSVQGDQTCHIFTISVKFAQLTEKFTVRLFDGEDELLPLFDKELNDHTETGYSFCAQDYIEQVRASSDDAQLLALVNALSDVGSLAQLQFNYNVDSRVDVVGDLDSVTAEMLAPYQLSLETREGTGISYYGSSLLLQEETVIRHYFRLNGVPLSQVTFKVDGKTVQPVQKGRYYYIEIGGIVAKDLDKSFHVVVSTKLGDLAVSMDYCALSYVWKNFSKGDGDDTLRSLLRALTLYSQAADAYFGS